MNGFGIRRGNPTPVEIAIAVSVLHAAAGARAATTGEGVQTRSNWSAPSRLHRSGTHGVGPAAWSLSQRLR